MTTIPENISIPLDNLKRSAIKSLLDSAPPGLQLRELLDGIVVLGLSALVKYLPLPEITQRLEEGAQAVLAIAEGRLGKELRVAADFVGFPITESQSVALDELVTTHPRLTEEDVCRMLLDIGIRDIQNDAFAQELLAFTREKNNEGERS